MPVRLLDFGVDVSSPTPVPTGVSFASRGLDGAEVCGDGIIVGSTSSALRASAEGSD